MAVLTEQAVEGDHGTERNNQKQQKKKSQGKRKISIKLITKLTSRQVTFSKRRNGLFKKASELCCLCGVEVAIIAFSGAGKLFSFGHPSADSVIRRYLFSLSSSSSSSSSSDEGKDAIAQIATQKKMSSMASTDYNNNGGVFWWDEPIDELGLVELEQMKAALEGLRNRAASRLNEISANYSSGCNLISDSYNDNSNYNVVGDHRDEFYDFGSMDWSNMNLSHHQTANYDDYNGMDYALSHAMTWTNY